MLAAGKFDPWMIPPMLILLGGWLFYGGYLFQKSLMKNANKRRVRYGEGVLTSFLCGTVGGVPAALALFVGMNLGSPMGRALDLIVCGIAGLICFAVIAYMVLWTRLKKESAQTAFRVALVPLVVIIAMTAVIGAGIAVPAYFQATARGMMNKHIKKTRPKLSEIYDALQRNFSTNPPQTLDVLVKQGFLSADTLKSPANPDGKGFFYYPPVKLLSFPDEKHKDQLLACDFTENFDGEYYGVVYTYGRADVLREQAFKALLNEPINKEFAEAFRKADKK